MKTSRLIIVSSLLILAAFLTARAEISFRYSDSRSAIYNLEKKKIIRPLSDFKDRLDFAEELLRLFNRVFDGSVQLDKKTYSSVEVLVDEFKDELKILNVRDKVLAYSEKERNIRSAVSGRFLTTLRSISASPVEPDATTLLPAVNLTYLPRGDDLIFNLEFRTTISQPAYLKVDEASVFWRPWRWGSVKFGRIYFILGQLGLIGDNNFDAFEGCEFKLSPGGIFDFTGIYSRLSSTNYPYTNRFSDSDDYLATRVSKEFLDKRVEVGINTLFSGIASEDGLSFDLYWRISKNREFITECAFYRPSKTTILTDVNPYDAKYAVVAGMDLIDTKRFNVFLQLGDVQKGFTPMATSLVYSAQNHLYFDTDSRGFDITISYSPLKKAAISQWQTRGDRTGKIPQMTIYELNIVGLWDSAWAKSQNRYILRCIKLLRENMRFYLENCLWDKESSELRPIKGVYNELRVYLVYEL